MTAEFAIDMDFLDGRATYWNKNVAQQYIQPENTDPWIDSYGADPDDFDGTGGALLHPDVVGKPANLVSSRIIGSSMHKPCLDIDTASWRVETSTPGHSHLFFNNELTWEQYSKLLDVLAECGMVDAKWVEHSKEKGETTVRYPGVRKLTYQEWLEQN